MPVWEIAVLVVSGALAIYLLIVLVFFGVILRFITKNRDPFYKQRKRYRR